ncbi:alcohol dehydrogenase [Westiellopsis prolifica IICB1]|nr:alcohol dehydrogenase [Westiellopsis prolifica IICB1]
MYVKAYAAKQPGSLLEPYEFELHDPKEYECLIKVQYCGVCRSDVSLIDNNWGVSNYPLVPGHEVIGTVEAVGSHVQHLQIGERVGVGWQHSACLQCSHCLRSNENLCSQIQATVLACPGGFADYLLTDSRFAFPIPQELESCMAGPLLCGGITVYAGLRSAGMGSGQEIGIIGVGGLGHIAVQFAKRLGNKVTVFTTSENKAEFAHYLGADHTIIVAQREDPPKPERKLDIILSTVPENLSWGAYLDHLEADGTLVFVGLPKGVNPLIELPLFALVDRRLRVMGSPIGGRSMITDMLLVAARFQIHPKIEVFPVEEVNEAIERVRSNQVRYRAVLEIS